MFETLQKSMGNTIIAFCVACVLGSASPSDARRVHRTRRPCLHSICIYPGNYTGNYRVDTSAGEPIYKKRPRKVCLPPGRYNLRIAEWNLVPFVVDNCGRVHSENSAAVVSRGNRLFFRTVPITIDPDTNGYRGKYNVHLVTNDVNGETTVNLVPNLYQYELEIAGASGFLFGVDRCGRTSSGNLPALTATNSNLTLNTVRIRIESDAPNYLVHRGPPFPPSGDRIAVLVPNSTEAFYLIVGELGVTKYYSFKLDATGNPTDERQIGEHAFDVQLVE